MHGDFRLRQPAGRARRAARRPRLGAGPRAATPAEDIGWLCAPAWRFGGPGEVGGFGEVDELLDAYTAAGGARSTRDGALVAGLRDGQVGHHLRPPGVGPSERGDASVELAAIGRRVCESEWDLFVLLGVVPAGGAEGEPAQVRPPQAPFGRPTAAELVEAVREYLESTVMERSEGRPRFEARVARNALAVVERELALGPALAAAHARRVRSLGAADDAALAAAIRTGAYDDRWDEVAGALAASARDQLLVANPSYLSTVWRPTNE